MFIPPNPITGGGDTPGGGSTSGGGSALAAALGGLSPSASMFRILGRPGPFGPGGRRPKPPGVDDGELYAANDPPTTPGSGNSTIVPGRPPTQPPTVLSRDPGIDFIPGEPTPPGAVKPVIPGGSPSSGPLSGPGSTDPGTGTGLLPRNPVQPGPRTPPPGLGSGSEGGFFAPRTGGPTGAPTNGPEGIPPPRSGPPSGGPPSNPPSIGDPPTVISPPRPPGGGPPSSGVDLGGPPPRPPGGGPGSSVDIFDPTVPNVGGPSDPYTGPPPQHPGFGPRPPGFRGTDRPIPRPPSEPAGNPRDAVDLFGDDPASGSAGGGSRPPGSSGSPRSSGSPGSSGPFANPTLPTGPISGSVGTSNTNVLGPASLAWWAGSQSGHDYGGGGMRRYNPETGLPFPPPPPATWSDLPGVLWNDLVGASTLGRVPPTRHAQPPAPLPPGNRGRAAGRPSHVPETPSAPRNAPRGGVTYPGGANTPPGPDPFLTPGKALTTPWDFPADSSRGVFDPTKLSQLLGR